MQEAASRTSGTRVALFIQNLRPFRKRGNHQSIPAGQDFVIEVRPGTPRTDLQQFSDARWNSFLLLSLIQDITAGEFAVWILVHVAVGFHAEVAAEYFRVV